MRISALLFFILISFTTKAQNYDIVYVSGKVSHFVKTNKAQWQSLTGNPTVVLKRNSVVRLEKFSTLVMRNQAGNFIEVKMAGTFKVSDLETKNKVNPNSKLHEYYLKFIWNELTAHHDDPARQAKKNMKVVGGVSRGDAAKNPVYFTLEPYDSARITSDTMIFRWRLLHAGTKKYKQPKIIILPVDTESFYTPYFEVDATDTVVKVPLSSLKLEKGRLYTWYVTPHVDSVEGFISIRSNFMLASDSMLAQMKRGEPTAVKDMPAAVHALIMASYYRSRNYFSIARTWYEASVRLDPSSVTARRLRDEFMEDYSNY